MAAERTATAEQVQLAVTQMNTVELNKQTVLHQFIYFETVTYSTPRIHCGFIINTSTGGSMSQPLLIVDAFTDGPFTGNPAAVCLLTEDKTATWMQAVAGEMNLSETAFLRPAGVGLWRLRWFTPLAEVDLCGHATLAAAHALWTYGGETAVELRFQTASGELAARRAGEWITLDFPADHAEPVEPIPGELLAYLGVTPEWVGQGRDDLLVVLSSAAQVRALQPDPCIAGFTRRGLIVTAPGDEAGLDMVSRFFAPKVGIPEDPVTGSAHCLLAVYWGQRLGKTRLSALQASARTGLLQLEWQENRVFLSGQAKTMMEGVFHG